MRFLPRFEDIGLAWAVWAVVVVGIEDESGQEEEVGRGKVRYRHTAELHRQA